MNVDRLLHLKGLLERDAANPTGVKFDLREWVRPGDVTQPNWKPAIDCGTKACAVGLACLDPQFNEQGLSLQENNVPTFDNNSGWLAVSAFFDIDHLVAIRLFDADTYPASKTRGAAAELEVAGRIEELIGIA